MDSKGWIAAFPGVWKYETGSSPITLTGIAGVGPAPYLNELPATEKRESVEVDRFNNHTVIRIPLKKNETVFG